MTRVMIAKIGENKGVYEKGPGDRLRADIPFARHFNS